MEMKIKLLIAAEDREYADHLSNVLTGKHADTFDVSVVFSVEKLEEALKNKYDAALVEPALMEGAKTNAPPLLRVLYDGTEHFPQRYHAMRINKYQRIPSIVSHVLEGCAELGTINAGFNTERARITSVWSPAGGAGKTTTALAYAARKVLEGKQVLYLSLEHFSSASAYFAEGGKSISEVFEKLDSNLHILLRAIRRQDSGSGIWYFCGPNDYDDINVLTDEDIAALINACCVGVDELVIDLPSVCDGRTQKIFGMSDLVFLVCDAAKTSRFKLRQFMDQHDVAYNILSKAVLIGNKGAKLSEDRIARSVQLPFVQTNDAIVVYKTLSGHSFER